MDTNEVGPFAIADHMVHLGLGARTVPQPTFTEPWDVWEMHPVGSELVLVTAGELVLMQESPEGKKSQVTVPAGSYAINAPSYWHTADASEPTNVVFVTAGVGTEHRPR